MSTTRNWATFPAASDVLGSGFWPGSEEDFVDPGGALEYGISIAHDERRLAAAAHEMKLMLDRAPDEGLFEDEMAGFGLLHIPVPEGNSWRTWGVHALRRVEQALADPSTIETEAEMSRFQLPRTSRFLNKKTADTASTLVMRANEARVRAWSADPEGWWRLHLYADLGHEVGRVLGRAPNGSPAKQTVAATGAVVLLQRHHDDGQTFIATAYPELSLDTAIRARFPDLCNAFGGYFGQDMSTVPWGMRQNLLTATRDPARSRMRAQLAELLTLDDQQLHAAVHSLGSYVLPVPLRPWVRRLLSGIDDYDWTA